MSPLGPPSGRSSPTLPSVAVKDSELPPLPEIQSERLSQRVFMRSVGHKNPFRASDASVDNEE